MNRNTTIVLALIIISGLVLGAVFVLPLLVPPPAMSMLVEFHDKDGKLIDVPSAITAGGREVKELKVTASWTISGTDIDPDSFNVKVTYKIGIKDLDGVWQMLDTRIHDSAVMVSSHAETWTLTTLLYEYMSAAYKEAGWDLKIHATLVATATDTSGDAVEPVTMDTPTVTATLTWVETTGALCIISCDVTRVIVIA